MATATQSNGTVKTFDCRIEWGKTFLRVVNVQSGGECAITLPAATDWDTPFPLHPDYLDLLDTLLTLPETEGPDIRSLTLPQMRGVKALSDLFNGQGQEGEGSAPETPPVPPTDTTPPVPPTPPAPPSDPVPAPTTPATVTEPHDVLWNLASQNPGTCPQCGGRRRAYRVQRNTANHGRVFVNCRFRHDGAFMWAVDRFRTHPAYLAAVNPPAPAVAPVTVQTDSPSAADATPPSLPEDACQGGPVVGVNVPSAVYSDPTNGAVNTHRDVQTHSTATHVRRMARKRRMGTGTADQKIAQLESLVSQVREDDIYFGLNYQIPTEIRQQVGCPAARLWRIAAGDGGSYWFLPARHCEHPILTELMATWSAHGVTWSLLEYSEKETQRIRKMATDMLEKQIADTQRSMIECIAKADASLREAMEKEGITLSQQQQADTARDNRVRSIIREAQERLSRAIGCAETFDETMKTKDLLIGLREAIRAQAAAFNALVAAKRTPGRNEPVTPASVI